MPTWQTPCPLKIKILPPNTAQNQSSYGGATSLSFGNPVQQHMAIEGPADRLCAAVLPHEITHTVFAAYFKRPLNRWADEGGAVLSEDLQEVQRHDKMTRAILNQGAQFKLRALFAMKDYPSDNAAVMRFYAQSFSITYYMVSLKGRRTFLAFAKQGMESGWDIAIANHYQPLSGIDQLESAWLANLKATKGQALALLPVTEAKRAPVVETNVR